MSTVKTEEQVKEKIASLERKKKAMDDQPEMLEEYSCIDAMQVALRWVLR